MGVDLKQFHQVFIEESFEGLDIMEDALMALDVNAIDSETINAIFRAAHSIKGGSATFGFSAIAGFTHVLETLLDQVRAGQRGLTPADVNLFLQSVDCMREMLQLLQSDQNVYTDSALRLKTQFEALLQVGVTVANASQVIAENIDALPGNSLWLIEFAPHPTIFSSGNCPVRILSALQNLGEREIDCETTMLPPLRAMDPERCYLSWQIRLHSHCNSAEIDDMFAWVADGANINTCALSQRHHQWRLTFTPKYHLLRSGNEPLKILSQLREVGFIAHTNCVVGALPTLKSLDPENLYLAWQLDFYSDLSQDAILAVFDWVVDDADISLQAIDTNLAEPLAMADIQSASSTMVALNTLSHSPLPKENLHDAPAAEHKLTKLDTQKKSVASEASSIRVGIDKIDSLINMVGELVITQSMLGQLSNELDPSQAPKLLEGLNQLAQNTRELQENVMRIRMLPISFTFSRFPRMVRDLSQQLGKKVHLELSGENTELDKTVMEKIGDPLVHLVRNAVDHGIELPAERLAKGKPEEGTINLNAYHQSGNVIIEITDDGKGLDRERILAKALEKNLVSPLEVQNFSDEQVFDLIFQPGFSTAQTVSDVSGRGVGMDVVKRNIQALNGVVEIQSKAGLGSKILIRLPLTLAILDGQLVRVGRNIYIFPLVSIVESMQYKIDQVRHIAGGCNVFKLREDFVPIVHLKDIFNIPNEGVVSEQPLMVVVEAEGEKVGVVVDELLAQQQVVIKSLEQNYRKVDGISGATILGDGTVSLILDIEGIVKIAGIKQLQALTMMDAVTGNMSSSGLSVTLGRRQSH